MTMAHGDRLFVALAFDKVLEPWIGCDADILAKVLFLSPFSSSISSIILVPAEISHSHARTRAAPAGILLVS